MKKMYRYSLLLCISMGVMALAGCNKLLDYFEDNPTAEYSICKIKKLTYFTPFDTTTATFVYNSYGDPVSITPSSIGTGRPQHLFRYNSKRQLTDVIRAYDNGYFETWARYVYDNQGRVIRDTGYAFGQIIDPPSSGLELGRFLTIYEYDSRNRITRTVNTSVDHPGSYPTIISTYAYDGNGNLVIPGATYDNKINLHRTHRFWMFLDRDYSVNNLVSAGPYNGYGLPEKFAGSFLSQYGEVVKVKYECD
jgi:hypothetical protein